MRAHPDESLQSPLLVWTYNRREGVARLAACQAEYVATDYAVLVHPEDLRNLLLTIKRHLKRQRRQHRTAGQFVNLHRVRNAQGQYCSHRSLITLACDASKHLAFLFGVDYLAPPNVSASDVQLPVRASAPIVERRKTDQGYRAQRTCDPFAQTWRCAAYVVSPSLFRMVSTHDGSTVELSEKQSRFIALLLSAKNSAGMPVYVRRALTRQQVFASDPDSRVNDNDIDRLVKFFRQHFGRAAIGTKRGYGHILRAEHTICEGSGMTQTLSLLWQERSSETVPTQS